MASTEASASAGAPDKVDKSECVKVVVRCRPMVGTESGDSVVHMDTKTAQVSVTDTERSAGTSEWTFDGVFNMDSTQEEVYARAVASIVDFVLQGFNGTIFAYGQTGTGKTHTMEGVLSDPAQRGVTPRSFDHIFAHIAAAQAADPSGQFLVSCQFVEIYQDEVFDLLVPKGKAGGGSAAREKLALREARDGSIFVAGATKHVVRSAAELLQHLEYGKQFRATAATEMNPGSSRSHCVFTLTVETCETRGDGQSHIRVGKLNLVDLAGSERADKTKATGARLQEGAAINGALACLGQVISALTSKTATFVPYRSCKLTRLLQDSLGGNTKTVMIANIGGAAYNLRETRDTLRFASRAKRIQNKPRINEDPKDGMLREYREQIERMRAALEAADRGDLSALEQLDLPDLGVIGGDGPAGAGAREAARVRETVQHVGISKDQIDEVEREAQRKKEKLQERHQQETASILEQEGQLASRAAQAAEAVAARSRQLDQQKQSREALASRLKAAEERLQMDRRLLSESQADAARLAAHRAEIERQAREAEEHRAEIQRREEEFVQSLQRKNREEEGLQQLYGKLEKLRGRYAKTKQQTEDLEAEQNREREDLLDQIRELSRHLQFQDLLLEHFVPREQQAMIAARAVWDDDKSNFALSNFDFRASLASELRPGSVHPGAVRPVSNFERYQRAMQNQSLRFAAVNVLPLELDALERTTRDLSDFGLGDPEDNGAGDDGADGYAEDDGYPAGAFDHYASTTLSSTSSSSSSAVLASSASRANLALHATSRPGPIARTGGSLGYANRYS